jgi:hypothetical protein
MKKDDYFYFIENPCTKNNPCLNSGTCFGRYNINGTLYTQCFCLQGYTGVSCEGNMNEKKRRFEWCSLLFLFLATVCSSTSCNGGLCTATQNNFVCQCPTGKVGDRCQVKFYLKSPFLGLMILILFLVHRSLCE